MVVWEAWNDQTGIDPFDAPSSTRAGHVTHGHLTENNDHGGNKSLGVNLKKLPTCHTNKVDHRRLPLPPRRLHLDRAAALHADGHARATR